MVDIAQVSKAIDAYLLVLDLIICHIDFLFLSSSCGGSFNVGMLRYYPQSLHSDDTDVIWRTRIRYGTSLFFRGAHVSVCLIKKG